MAQYELMNIRSWTNSWRFLTSLKCSNRSSNFNSHNYIINVSISILFHSRCSCANPSTQRRKLNWIWLMSTTYTKFRKFFLHILSNNTSFNTSHHIIFVNPFNLIHSRNINRNNCSLLFLVAKQRFCYICSSILKY